MKKEWTLQTPDPELVSFLSRSLKISKILAILLVNRGLDDIGDAELFLSGTLKDLPNPFLMKDMKKAVDRILLAVKNHESIFVYGDYDVDGVTATSNLILFFRQLGIPIGFHIPHRLKEGYGLHVDALKEIQQKGGTVVITADCGISNVKEAQSALDLGIDLIITDHHIIPPKLPDAHAVLNPLRPDSDFPDLYPSGVGVTFLLMMALRNRLREIGFFKERREPNLRNFLDLVALGTIADMVPLKGMNHILVKEGLEVLTQKNRPGVRALIDVSKLQGNVIGTYEVGFQLAPRLNAGGRLAHAEIAVKLLTSQDYFEGLQYAQKLDLENSQRRLLQAETLQTAMAMIEKDSLHQKKSIVLSSPHWHPGVIGIVASKIVEKYYRPTCLISETEELGKGSGRSIQALHLVDALKECSSLFETFGGHKAAAGFSIRLENIAAFKTRFEETVAKSLSDDALVFKPKADLEINLDEVSRELLDDIEKLSPFGMGNPEPVFLTKDFKINRATIVGEKHLKLRVEGSQGYHDAIGFNLSQYASDTAKAKSLFYTVGLNRWKGVESIQLKLKDLKF